MTIQSIRLEHTNPSLGPHETRTVVTLLVTKDNCQKIDQFINTAQINNTTSLYNYLKAKQTENKEVLDRIIANAPVGKLENGTTISNLSFYFEDGQIVVLSDVYRRFELTHFYPEFTHYMVEKGTVERFDSTIGKALYTELPENNESDETNETSTASE